MVKILIIFKKSTTQVGNKEMGTKEQIDMDKSIE